MERRRRARTPEKIKYNLPKRLLAFVLALTMVLTNVGADINTVFAATSSEPITFSMSGSQLVKAIEEAVAGGNKVTAEDLDFTNGKIAEFEKLFDGGEGTIYEAYPEPDGGSRDAELRVFVRLPEDADDMYMLTGDEEVIFLYVNNGEDTISCTTEITRMDDGVEKVKKTKRITVKSYEAAYGDEEVNIISKPAEETTAPEESEDSAAGETTSPTESQVETTAPSEDGTVTVPGETEETTEVREESTTAPDEGETAEPEDSQTEAETEKAETGADEEKAQEADGPKEVEAPEIEVPDTEASEKSEPVASIVRHFAPVVAENENGNAVDSDESKEEAFEKEETDAPEEKEETVKEKAEAVEENKAAADEKGTEASEPSEVPETKDNPDGTTEDAMEETTAAAGDEATEPDTDESTVEGAEAPAESGTGAEDNSDSTPEVPSESVPVPDTATSSEAKETTEAAKTEDSVSKAGSSDLVGIGYCSTAKVYTTTLNQLKALDDFDGYKVSYAFYPEYSGRIVEGMRGVEEGEALTFGVKNQIGYTVDNVVANGETLVSDSITDNSDGSQTINYSVPDIYEEQEVEVYMLETEAHPEFNQVLEMEDGTIITLYAQEGVLPAGVEAEASVVSGIEDAIREKVESESGDEIIAVSAVAYDINLMLNGHKLDNSWSGSGYVEVTFSGDKIGEMQEEADGIEVFALDDTKAETLSAETAANLTASELKLEKVGENDVSIQSDDEISFRAKHFTIYTPVAYQSKAAEPKWYSGTFMPTIEHAEVAYLFYHNEESHEPFTEVLNGESIKIEQFFNKNNKGHMVFFVKPEEGYLLTGVGASGNGDMYSLNLENFGNINNYPGIHSIATRAKAEGYMACFGFSRVLKNDNQKNFTATLEVKGVKPGLTVEAVSSKTENVLPEDMLEFTVTITPKTVVNGKTLTVEGVSVESLTINGQSVDYSGIKGNSDGTYTTMVVYKVSEEDCEKGGIILDVNADVDYSYYLSLSDSNHITSNVITRATVIDSASVACSIAAQKGVQYKLTYENAPDGSFPDRVTQETVDSKKYYQNDKVSVDATRKDGEIVRDEKNGGFWTFDGWYLAGNKVTTSTVKMTEAGLEFVGVWTFKNNLTVDVKYVEYIADKTDYSKVAELSDREQLKGIYREGYTVARKTIPNYEFKKVIDNNNPKTFHEDMETIYVTYTKKRDLSVNVKYVEYVADDTDYSAAAEIAQQARLTGAYLDTYSPEVKRIEDYVFEKVIDNNSPNRFHEGMTTIYVAYSRQIEITITAESARFTYDGKAHGNQKVTVTDGELIPGDKLEAEATGSVTNVVDSAAGNNPIKADYKITRGTEDVTGKYKITPVAGTLTIYKRPVTITFEDQKFTYDGEEHTWNKYTVDGLVGDDKLEAAAGGRIKYPSQSPIANDIEGSYRFINGDAGNYDVKVVPGELTMTYGNQVDITIKAASQRFIYDGKAHHNPEVTVTAGELMPGDKLVAKAKGSITNVIDNATDNNLVEDGYKIINGNEDVTGKYKITPVAGTLTIDKKPVTITFENQTFSYDGSEHTWNNYTVDGLVGDDALKATAGGRIQYPNQTPVENGLVEYTFTKGDAGNYEVKAVPGKLSMIYGEPVDITITAASQRFTYDGEAHGNPTVTLTEGELMQGDVLVAEASGSITNFSDNKSGNNPVSSYKIMNGTEDVTEKYKVKPLPGTLTITKKQVTITFEDKEFTYDGEQHTWNGYKVDGLVGEDALEAAANGIIKYPSQTPVKNDIAEYTFTKGDARNYDVSVIPGELTMTYGNPVDITIRAASQRFTYDGKSHNNPEVTVMAGELMPGDKLVAEASGSITNFAENRSDNNLVSSYKIMNGTEDVTEKYKVKPLPGTLTITKKQVTITFEDKEFTYDGEQHTWNGHKVDGLVGEDALDATANGIIKYPSQTPVKNDIAEYTFTKGDARNYDVSVIPGELTMTYGNPVDITIRAASQRFTYDGKSHDNPEVTVMAGELMPGDKLVAKAEGSVTVVSDSATGNNPVEAGFKIMNGTEDVTGKYTITPEAGTLEIIPRKATITVISASKVFGEDDPTFTGTVEGLIAKDDLGIVDYGRIAADKDKDSVGDDISLTAYYKINQNYTVTIIPAKLKIVASGENEVMVTGREVTYDGTPYGLTDAHAAREGSTILYSTDNVTFTETEPVFTNAGVYVVYVKATKQNYLDTGIAEGKVIINKRDVTFTAGSASKVYDGTPLTNNRAEISSGSIADGQTWSVNVSGSQTSVGTSKNIASGAVIKAGNDDVTANYNINYISGDLTVTSAGGSSGGSGGSGGGGGTTDSGNRYTAPTGGPGETVSIAPEDVPLAQLPGTPIDTTRIDDGEIPLAALPKTGQSSFKTTFTMMMSGIFLVLVAMNKKRKEDS